MWHKKGEILQKEEDKEKDKKDHKEKHKEREWKKKNRSGKHCSN